MRGARPAQLCSWKNGMVVRRLRSGAERAAVMARLNNIDPKAWLADVFARQELPERVAAVELDASHVDVLRSGGVAMHVNKVHSVFTSGPVAKDLGKDEDWLWDANCRNWLYQGINGRSLRAAVAGGKGYAGVGRPNRQTATRRHRHYRRFQTSPSLRSRDFF